MLSEIKPRGAWGVETGGMLLCAGPCSAETEEQVLHTAHDLVDCRLSFFRAGVWKPRTRPGQFEGAGCKALRWLQRVQKETGLRVAVEVGSAEHVEACLAHGVDAVWIGARTTADPFSVQRIADALRGVAIPVLVKNPPNPDLDLWVGAMERLCLVGVHQVAAVHRGFSLVGESRYRNAPLWRIPIELKRRFPTLPLLCDPSHICGRVRLVPLIAQEALDLLYDGLMVEVHHEPRAALSDAKQQLTPRQFRRLIEGLAHPHVRGGAAYRRTMARLRREIDDVDNRLVDALAHRMRIVSAMGDCKRQHKVSVLQPQRWADILRRRVARGEREGLSAPFVSQIYQAIHEEAIRVQERDLLKED